MRRLTRPLGDERGATAVTVALLMVVLLGFGAIVVDVGALYQERRELQNGADAAALAVAEDCAKGDCGAYTATAATLAPANAGDDLAAVDGVAINMAAQTAKVDTSTSDAEGGSQILHWFAPVIGKDSSTVRASATAQWAALESGLGRPITFSKCEWDSVMGTTPSFPSPIVALTFHDGNPAEPCSGPAGQDLPGGFGWLGNDGDCEVELTAGDTYSSDPGGAPPKVCEPSDFIGQTILLPVFDDYSGQGQNGAFTAWGLATFEVTGGRLLMGNGAWTWGDISPCSTTSSGPVPTTTTVPKGNGNGGGTGNDQACLVGRFVKDVQLAGVPGEPGATPDLGTSGVRLIA